MSVCLLDREMRSKPPEEEEGGGLALSQVRGLQTLPPPPCPSPWVGSFSERELQFQKKKMGGQELSSCQFLQKQPLLSSVLLVHITTQVPVGPLQGRGALRKIKVLPGMIIKIF